MITKMILVFLIGGSFGRLILPPRWNGLKVNKKMLKDLPRTEADAVTEGFVKISDCDENPKFRGKQYLKNNDTTIILLFDKNGYIAGIQCGISKGLPGGYPTISLQPPFVDDGEQYKVTAYFVDPFVICRRGRSEQQFRLQGTGTDLFIQNGTNPEHDLIEIDQDVSTSAWIKGNCRPRMGYHYFWNVSSGMQCEDFLPVYLLYHEGNLKGFVWSFNANLNSSSIVPYEKPNPYNIGNIMATNTIPTCLTKFQRSTLHVYLENNPESYNCTADETSTGSSVLFSALMLFLSVIMSADEVCI